MRPPCGEAVCASSASPARQVTAQVRPRLTDLVRRSRRVADRVAHRVEEAPAAVDVAPALDVQALRDWCACREVRPFRVRRPTLGSMRAGDMRLARRSGIRSPARRRNTGQRSAACDPQCATAAAAASSIRRPVRKRSSENGASIGCGSPRAIGVGEDMARARRRLEAAGAPAAIHVKAGHRRLADDRRAIRRHIDDAAPVAQHAHAAEGREQLADRLQRVRRRRAARRAGCTDV